MRFLKQINSVTWVTAVRLHTVGEESSIHQIIAEPQPGAFECFHVCPPFFSDCGETLLSLIVAENSLFSNATAARCCANGAKHNNMSTFARKKLRKEDLKKGQMWTLIRPFPRLSNPLQSHTKKIKQSAGRRREIASAGREVPNLTIKSKKRVGHATKAQPTGVRI